MAQRDFRIVLPPEVVTIRKCKDRPHRADWILLAARDTHCDLCRVHVDAAGGVDLVSYEVMIPYDLLFAAVARMAHPKKQTWLLGFRTRYALRSAAWIKALQAGEIKLERQLKLAGKQAGRGAVNLSHSMTELDLRVGGRRVKMLDWSNYGVSAEDYQVEANNVTWSKCYEIFMDWIKAYTTIGLSASRSSAAQVGWAKLRSVTDNSNIYTSLDPEIRALERRCYYGGRCEAYRLGDYHGKVYQLDIKACYSAICKHMALPTQPLRWMPDGCPVEYLRGPDGSTYAADVIVNTQEPIYPVRHLGKVVYPIGRFKTSLCGVELGYAVMNGHVEKVLSAVRYITLPFLSDYSVWYVRSRNQVSTGDLRGQLPGLKNAFNSSLGFLARQGREWSIWEPAGAESWWFGVTNDPDDISAVVRAHVLGGECEILRVGSEPRNAAPIVHGAICALARQVLSELMRSAGKENVLYVDTDGLIVNRAGYDNLVAVPNVVGPGYGQLGIRTQAERCTINGQKSYKIGDKVVCAGMPASHHKDWTRADTLETDTGIADVAGFVTPFTFDCEDNGDESAKWQNVRK